MIELLNRLDQPPQTYWAERITAQCRYAWELAQESGEQSIQRTLAEALQLLQNELDTAGSISNSTAQEAEQILAVLGPRAKAYCLNCVGHAHIDMNWMWGYNETVAITLETFRTVLSLMEVFDEFTFSQSQASVYEIVAKYEPEMLTAIRNRISEGRWEVTASTWVETDKNMPRGETLVRHMLYTRRYLKQLLGLTDRDFAFDFEPDTFGHSRHVPELLQKGGVRYYYHCRGYDGHNIYRWQAPSGASVLVYREPLWYIDQIHPKMVLHVPKFCNEHGIQRMLKVYGIGDHGGGPTKRDLARIRDMADWPCFPTIRFGTYREYFSYLDTFDFPVVDHELNAVFTGCYTSQSIIKEANSRTERSLYQAEVLATAAWLADNEQNLQQEPLQSAWQNLMFNNFHDILPGSNTAASRNHALGLYQESLAVSETIARRSMRSLTKNVDAPADAMLHSTAEGAGVGFGLSETQLDQAGRAGGSERFFAAFNTLAVVHPGPLTLTVWDWEEDIERMEFRNASGEPLQHQVLNHGFDSYWGHRFAKVVVECAVPVTGLTCLHLVKGKWKTTVPTRPADPRVDRPMQLLLENECVRAEFSYQGNLISLRDKKLDKELIDPARFGGGLRYVLEDDREGMTSWRVGDYRRVLPLKDAFKFVDAVNGPVRQSLRFSACFGDSSLEFSVSLDHNATALRFDLQTEWYERGQEGRGVPQLQYYLPLNYRVQDYGFDVPAGAVIRREVNQDQPAVSWCWAHPDQMQSSLVLSCHGRHGYRGWDNALSLTLLRSSYDPDPAPEWGQRSVAFSIELVAAEVCLGDVIRKSAIYGVPPQTLSLPGRPRALEPRSLVVEDVDGPVMVVAIKGAEAPAQRAWTMRLVETEGKGGPVRIRTASSTKKVEWADLHETVTGLQTVRSSVDGLEHCFDIKPNEVVTLVLCLP